MTDEELLEAIAADPETGMSTVIDRYGSQLLGRLRAFAHRNQLGDSGVDDVFQTALLRLTNPDLREELRLRGGEILPWLTRWGYWRLRDEEQERRAGTDRPSSDPHGGDELIFEPSVAARAVSEALPLLRPRDSDILAMKYEERLTDEQVGERLGITKGAAKKAAHDARARLKKLLATRGIRFE